MLRLYVHPSVRPSAAISEVLRALGDGYGIDSAIPAALRITEAAETVGACHNNEFCYIKLPYHLVENVLQKIT